MSRQFSRRTALAGALAAVGVFSVMPAVSQEAVRIGTSSVGSSFYVIAVGMSQMIQKHAGINVAVEPLGGSHANVFGIGAGKVEFAITNSGSSYDGFHAVEPFKNRVDIRLVMQGQPTLRWFFVRKGSGISKPEDLVGKTLSSRRRPLPELEMITNALIKVYNLPTGKIRQVANVDTGELARTFRAGSIDAASFPFALRQPVASKLFADGVVEPLIIPENKFDEVMAALPPKFSKLLVPANNFENQPKPFLSLMMTAQLTTGAKVPEETVYRVTKSILGNFDEFVKFHGTAREWTIAQTLSDPKVPFHPGAVRYFKEAGAWTTELEAMQQQLLKSQ